jgi:hypothetical protein
MIGKRLTVKIHGSQSGYTTRTLSAKSGKVRR